MAKIKGTNLVPFNSKVTPEIKAITDALVTIQVNGCKSQHDLIKDMLKLYEERYPQAFEKAREFIALRAEQPDAPVEE